MIYLIHFLPIESYHFKLPVNIGNWSWLVLIILLTSRLQVVVSTGSVFISLCNILHFEQGGVNVFSYCFQYIYNTWLQIASCGWWTAENKFLAAAIDRGWDVISINIVAVCQPNEKAMSSLDTINQQLSIKALINCSPSATFAGVMIHSYGHMRYTVGPWWGGNRYWPSLIM